MLTALGTIAIAFLYVVGCSVCRTAKPYDDAATECERDREWWRGLEAAEQVDAEGKARPE